MDEREDALSNNQLWYLRFLFLMEACSDLSFEVGKPAWYFYGYKFTGVDKATGEPLFEDIDGDNVITDNDKTEIGKGIADFTYGITLTAAWKNFDFIAFGTGSYGNDIFCGLNRVDYNLNQLTYFTRDRWTASNTDGSKPRAYATDYTKFMTSSGSVFDGSYFKIKQLQFGYTIPNSLLKRAGLENLRIYFSLEDYFTFTDYPGFDPEVTLVSSNGVPNALGVDKGSYPNSRKMLMDGERRRLYLLKLLMNQPNVLLFDEPTNDLDIETLTVLEDYLTSFQGAALVVSHDRYFLDKVVEKLIVIDGPSGPFLFYGNMTDYLEVAEERKRSVSIKA